MLRSEERETEILLGNKQLIGIFFVIVVLLGVAFGGGYMVGRSGVTKPVPAAQATDTQPAAPAPSGGVTKAFKPDGGVAPSTPSPDTQTNSNGELDAMPPDQQQAAKSVPVTTGFVPQPGQQFLQVAAVSKDEGEALADVLHKQGFKAHAVPKPGNPKVYRVIVGPMRDSGDLYATREKLMKTGFREVITQRY